MSLFHFTRPLKRSVCGSGFGPTSRTEVRSASTHLAGVVITLLAVLLTACATDPVTGTASASAPDYDFSTAHTFDWYPPPLTGDPRLDSPLLDGRIRSAVSAELQKRGLQPADGDAADLLVTFSKALADRVEYHVVNRHYGYEPGWGMQRRPGATSTYVDAYTEGSLILDLIDARTQKLVWRGHVSGRVKEKLPEAQRQARLQKAVADLLADFPPR